MKNQLAAANYYEALVLSFDLRNGFNRHVPISKILTLTEQIMPIKPNFRANLRRNFSNLMDIKE